MAMKSLRYQAQKRGDTITHVLTIEKCRSEKGTIIFVHYLDSDDKPTYSAFADATSALSFINLNINI